MKFISTVDSDTEEVEITIKSQGQEVTTTMDKEEYLKMVAETFNKPKVVFND